ncbi:MAG: outer membrane protein assembly factor BamB, partial [Thermoproteota archaeon]
MLSAFDKNDGSEVWTVELPGSIEVISAKEDVVYVCCGKHLMALNAEGGEVIWD